MLKDTITAKVYEKFAAEHKEDWDIDGLNEYLEDFYVYEERRWKSLLKRILKKVMLKEYTML